MFSQLTHDVVFALSSAPGRAAIALHRVTGAGCLNALLPFLRMPTKNLRTGATVKRNIDNLGHSQARYATLVNENDEVIDDCLVTFFSGPRSYTGEDTLEICAHGNPLITARLHSLLRQVGFREAKPGEFTQRAFLNGKIDLTRAEAIDQLIHADTQAGIELARDASDGRIHEVTTGLRNQITSALAYFEAHIDFADDEVGSYDAQSQLKQLSELRANLMRLSETYSTGLKMREGLKIAFLGKPNAGKSSLYNALLGYERAIVTDIPGTTRDVVEDRLMIGNRDFVLMDTAGVRETVDTVEQLGVARSISSASHADIICLVLDVSGCNINTIDSAVTSLAEELLKPLQSLSDKKLIIVLTKSDKWQNELLDSFKQKRQLTSFLQQSEVPVLATSTRESDISELSKILTQTHDDLLGAGRKSKSAILISKRQQDKTLLAIAALDSAIDLVEKKDFPEKIASMLNSSAHHVSEIVGEIGTEDVLENIFSSFCIGK